MTTQRKSKPLYRFLASLLAALIALGPVATPAYAAATALADEPLNVKNSSKPNIVMTIDDSTSMLFDFLPDYVIDRYCRDGMGSMNSICGAPGFSGDFSAFGLGKDITPGYIFQQYNFPYTSFSTQDASPTPVAFDIAGPGSGCDASIPRCSPGIDVGASPGLPMYPVNAVYSDQTNPAVNSNIAYNAYGYWKLWPAPAHNNALNHLYYNPMLVYSPPAHADGTFFDSMNAANTSNWTKVPADPWASTILYVDLTANVTVGQWCNSDWSVGHENDPAYCRTNGAGPTATNSATASSDGDYLYPWVPAGINPFNNLGYQGDNVNASSGHNTIGMSIAYSKVTASGTAVSDSIWKLADASGSAKDSQYFYENDNVLWCDATAANWPAGAGQAQHCTATSASQTCAGDSTSTPKCVGGSQTCSGTAQTCKSNTQTCVNKTTTQTCQTSSAQTCNGLTAQTCQGYQTQTCTNKQSQSCNGFQTQTCGLASQTCNGVTNQTCVVTNKCAKSGSSCSTTADCPDDAATCTNQFDPPGCNTCVGPECGTCTLKTVCSKQACVSAGKCSSSGATCSTDANCPQLAGNCSTTGTSCTSNAQCPSAGHCSVNTGTVCTSNANCADINGTCSKTGVACQPANAGTQCPITGNCSVNTGTSCTADANCAAINGHCSIVTGTACTSVAQCPSSGKCSVSNAQCFNNAGCPNVGGTCNITGKACQTGNVCPKAGNCSIDTATRCDANGDCAAIKKCSITNDACNSNSDCPAQNLKCSISGLTCASNGDCPTIAKKCDANSGNVGATCSSNSNCTAIVTPGACTVSGAVCTSDAQCPAVVTPGICVSSVGGPNNGNSCNSNAECSPYYPPAASAFCSTNLRDGSHTLRYDAEHTGTVCRHNNQAYADGTPAAAFNYPNAKYNIPVTAGTGADACVATPRFKSVTRHYWKTNVEWCDTAIGSGAWNGYGDKSVGTCQSFKDTTHVYPRFYQFGAGPADSAYLDNTTTPAFARIDLKSGSSYSHTFNSVDWQNVSGPKVTGTDTVTRTYAEEMENYANWFAYYRTRIQAVKTVLSLSFLGKDPTTSKFNVDDKFRVGLHSLSADATSKIATMFVPVDDFNATQKASWATELYGLSVRIGQNTPNLDAMARIGEYYKNGTSDLLPNVSADPIVLSCQKNWHMLFTDGLTYQPTVPSVLPAPDQDDKIPTGSWLAGILTPGDPWPAPYREDPAKKIDNAASDFATYYWVTDLRGSMTNNVGVSAADKANWQHVNFAAISLGTEGKLAAGNQSGVESQLSAGTVQWPTPYPSVNTPDASGVDDLWHASVNSRGRFVNADNADEIKLGMGAILADIANTAGSRAGAALQTINLVGSTAYAYRVTFEPGWGGTLSKVQIDSKTYNEIPPAPWQVGGGKDVTAPADSLYAQLTPTVAKPEPWYTNRNIVTMHSDGTAIPFRFDSLSATQQDALAPGKPDRGLQVLEYLRGSQQNEGTATLNFRKRVSPLGDIVNASPKYVGPANLPYQEFADPGYSQFRADTLGRLPMVYAAANDGMLHAIDDSSGTERFAYVPRVLFRTSENAGLAALTLKEGALPPFKHHFYVDSTPKVVDVDFGSKDWHSILIGGLGKGGQAYYALDVTNPDGVLTEDDAAARVLWEFTDTDLGYTYGSPIITKTAGWSGKWVAIIPSGYNNTSGVGKIFFVDVKTGALLKTMSTGYGSTGSPSGLAQIAGFTQDYHNYMTDQVYGGDQYGNLWRFDLRDPDPSNWKVGLLATLTDPDGNVQPVTTAPQIEVDIANGADRWVFVGTGRLLDESDLSDDQIQSFYGIRDGTQKVPGTIVSGSPVIRSDLQLITDKTGTGGIVAHGWVDDLAIHSRIVTPYQAVLSLVVYSATKPQTDPCLTGQQADVFVRTFAQGISQIDDEAGVDSGLDCSTGEYCTSVGGAVSAEIVGTTSDGSPLANLGVAITLGTTGQVIKVPIKQPTWAYSNRLSWRILSE